MGFTIMATKTEKNGKEQTAAEKEYLAQQAEAYKMEQEAAEAAFRVEQGKRAAGIGKALLSEAVGGMAAAYSVGLLCWEYVNAEVIRHTGGKPERFTDAVRQLQKDIAARMTCEGKPNISRYLGYVGLAKLWNVDKLLSIPRSFAQNALPMITRDDTAPGLEYVQETARGNQTDIAYSWVIGCEEKGPALLDKLAAGIDTCAALTVDQFNEQRKGFLKTGGKGRRNQGGKNAGKGKGGKGGKFMTASKAAAKLSQALAAIKSYAALVNIPAATRLKGLAAMVAAVRELRDGIKEAAEKAAAGKGKAAKKKGGKAAAAELVTAGS
jgi:hypothetical protein